MAIEVHPVNQASGLPPVISLHCKHTPGRFIQI